MGVDEQTFEFSLAVHSIKHAGESEDAAVTLSNEDLPVGDLTRRNNDRVGMGQHSLAVPRIRQRRSQLQCLERVDLIRTRASLSPSCSQANRAAVRRR